MSDLKIYSFGEWKLFDYGAVCAISRNDGIPCLILSRVLNCWVERNARKEVKL